MKWIAFIQSIAPLFYLIALANYFAAFKMKAAAIDALASAKEANADAMAVLEIAKLERDLCEKEIAAEHMTMRQFVDLWNAGEIDEARQLLHANGYPTNEINHTRH